jgi:pentatricopeptide repeat protein
MLNLSRWRHGFKSRWDYQGKRLRTSGRILRISTLGSNGDGAFTLPLANGSLGAWQPTFLQVLARASIDWLERRAAQTRTIPMRGSSSATVTTGRRFTARAAIAYCRNGRSKNARKLLERLSRSSISPATAKWA